jgi:hypothetical protein
MKIELKEHICIVTREPGDKRFSGVVGGKGESALLHAVKQKLNQQGGDFIKKRMWRDGHLVDDLQQYVRSRKLKPGAICIYNPSWAVNGAEVNFNAGQVILAVHALV